jgi:hypothetical protein
MVKNALHALAPLAAVALLFGARPVAAETPAETPADLAAAARAAPPAVPAPTPARVVIGEPRAHHDPVSTARVHEDLKISVTLDHPESIKSAGVVFRTGKGELRLVPLLRGGEGDAYVAVIPGAEVTSPGIGYAIEVERIDGRRVPLFASRGELSPVEVMDDRMDVHEQAFLKRLDGRRSVVTASGELVRFGTTTGASKIPCAAKQTDCAEGALVRPVVDDQYWRVEVGYTYRPLRVVEEFSLRIGVVRGTSLVDLAAYDTSKYKVGLNYASPSVRFRAIDALHFDLSLLTSITEIGFSVGGGGAILIGDPYGTRLTLGAEVAGVTRSTYFGSRFYAKLDLALHSRVILAPTVEVTDMPHAETFGVRLYSDLSFNLGKGFGLSLRGGYQARKSTSGGVGLGGALAYAF